MGFTLITYAIHPCGYDINHGILLWKIYNVTVHLQFTNCMHTSNQHIEMSKLLQLVQMQFVANTHKSILDGAW
jgi:hypothetical protein